MSVFGSEATALTFANRSSKADRNPALAAFFSATLAPLRPSLSTSRVVEGLNIDAPRSTAFERLIASAAVSSATPYSGTSLRNVHVKPGGEVICHEESHVYKYEGGGIARNSGASVRLLRGDRGRITAKEIEKYINPINDVHFPISQLVSIEDTANRGGGAIYDFEEILKIKAVCQANNLPLHLDGARLMNALAVNGIDTHTYCAPFDSISICLSKGLGAPVGSLLLGSADFILKARRVRKVFGGGMRQAGFIAAAGLFALKYNVDRLIHDHSHAKLLEIGLKKCAWVADIVPVETNIVIIQLTEMERRDQLILELAKNGIKVIAFGPGLIRMVTHLQITKEDIEMVCLKALSIN